MREFASLYAPVLALGTLLSLALGAYGWRRRHLVPGGAAFAVFNLGVAVWTGVDLIALDTTGADALFWANVAYFGIVLVPASWLVFALRYSGHGRRVTKRVLALLSIEPVATVLLAWTNPWHQWFRVGVDVTPTWEPAPGFWIHAAYSYALVLAGTVLVGRRAISGPRLGRDQAGVLLIGALAPWTANAIYLSGLSPFGNLDPSPFGFGITSLAAGWVLFRDLEQRLVAAERRLRALIDHTADAIEVIDADTGRFLDVNERACVARGYTRDEYLRLSAPEIDSQVAQHSWQETRDEARRLGSYVFESEHRRKNGSTFPVEVNATYVSLDRDYVLAVVRDTTERSRAEAKFRGLLESAPDAMVIAEEGGAIVLVNAQTEKLFGYPRAELLGRPVEVLFPERFRDQVTEERLGYKTGPRQRHLGAGLFALRSDGTELPVEINLSPLQSDDGMLVSAAIRDVTEMKRLEEQFRQAQKMEAVGRLAGGIAHDFNNILGIIVGYAELVSRRLVDDEPLRLRVEQIIKAAERAAGLTRQLLAFSRQQVLQPKILDLNAVVLEMDDMLRRLLGRGIALVTILGPELGSVEADQGQLEHVIMNLAVNARDAMPDGGQLKIETKNVLVAQEDAARYPLMKPGHYVMLALTDTGSGMDANVLAHIFEPFFTTKDLGKGTGLGLSTVYGIVEQSGGRIDVDSDPATGTTFRIYLPQVTGAPRPQVQG